MRCGGPCSHSPVFLWDGRACLGGAGFGEDTSSCVSPAWVLKGLRFIRTLCRTCTSSNRRGCKGVPEPHFPP